MTLDGFYSLSTEEKDNYLKSISNKELIETPFLIERLHTALSAHNPLCLIIDGRMKEVYWEIISFRNKNIKKIKQ
jgi:hypothetical protein